MYTDFRANRRPRNVWNWDEYDEIWGFDHIPRDYPDRERHMEAFIDRSKGNTPTMLEKKADGLRTLHAWKEG